MLVGAAVERIADAQHVMAEQYRSTAPGHSARGLFVTHVRRKNTQMEAYENETCDNCHASNVTTYGLGAYDIGVVMEFCAPCVSAVTKCRSCRTAQAMAPVDNRAPWQVEITYEALCNECWTAQIKKDMEEHAASECEPDWDGMARDHWESRNDGPTD